MGETGYARYIGVGKSGWKSNTSPKLQQSQFSILIYKFIDYYIYELKIFKFFLTV